MVRSHQRRKRVSSLAILAVLSCGHVAVGQPPPGFVDASTFGGGFNPSDSTSALQAAIESGSDVWVPNMGTDWNVTPIFLTQSNQTILFEEGVVVAAKPGAFLGTHDNLFTNTTRVNVRLEGYGATLRMRQQDYIAPPYPPNPEFRMGISALTVDGFEIVGLTIENTGGDGIYISDTNPTDPNERSQNVLIQDVVIDNAYRNGISISSASGVVIDNVVIASSSGHAPQAGIDLEPDTDMQPVENITIRNSIMVGNFDRGIVWSLKNTPSIPDVTGTVENLTIIGNGNDGLDMAEESLPGWTIKDSLIIDNFGAGFSVLTDCQVANCSTPFAIEYSALFGNLLGALEGTAALGTGSITTAEPDFVAQFVSTDLHHPYFMYLEPTTPTAIRQGASDGKFMGARPVLWTGDMDGDGLVTNADVPWFIQAWANRTAYDANGFTTPGGDPINADLNGDLDRNGVFDSGDIKVWNTLLAAAAAAAAVPEPDAAILCVAAALTGLLSKSRRQRASP
jgi:hypothetical protein